MPSSTHIPWNLRVPPAADHTPSSPMLTPVASHHWALVRPLLRLTARIPIG